MHRGFTVKLEEHMQEAFHNRFRVEIRTIISTVREVKAGSGEPADISIDAILAGRKEYADCTQRERDWFSTRHNVLSRV
jgi:hypothetical protein